MKTLIKNTATKLAIAGTKIAHHAFNVLPPSTASVEEYKVNPSEFENKCFANFEKVNSAFGKITLAALVLTRNRKTAHKISATGLLFATTHIYHFYNVKYHANKVGK